MPKNNYKIKSKIWLYQGSSAWHFITLPQKISEQIKEKYKEIKKGWGSLPVEVKLGKTNWKTSIFPDSKRKAYVLPIKAAVRKSEKIEAGDSVNLLITINNK